MKGRRYPLGIQTFKNIIEGNYGGKVKVFFLINQTFCSLLAR